ncbi:MAG TPA: hypothetical protein DEA08_30380 [Planctomycetes bacterium]|nr:hypothetical protein [Planctomycetota bacterium]
MKQCVLILALLLAGPVALAETYQVSAPGYAGRLEVGSGGEATLTMTPGKRPRRGKSGVVTRKGTLTAITGGLRFDYSVQVKPGLRRGAAAWVRNPRFSLDAWGERSEARSATFARTQDEVFEGKLEGRALRLNRAVSKNWIVLVVPGLSTNNWNKVGIPYLDENLRALRARGVEARRLGIKTENGVALNAAYIAAEIRKEAARGKKVIVMAHSKGGTDTTAALALEPDLARSVLGVIAIQPVYGGSYVADFVAGQRQLSGTMAFVFEKVFKGERAAVLDLTHQARAAFVAAHPYPAKRVPTVVVRSSFDRRASVSTLYAPQKLIKRTKNEPSDGLVTPADQTIPGAKATIDLDDLDHFEPGVRLESPHKPVDVTNRAMDELLVVLRKELEASVAAQFGEGEAPPRYVGQPLGE